MKRVLILVEGQTEETFVRDILTPTLAQKGTIAVSILLTTKRVKNRNRRERAMPGRRFKGGVSTYSKVKRDITNLLSNDRSASAVTTMLDFYGLPADFPGKDSIPVGDCYQRVRHLEEAFAKDIENSRFKPFLVLHEFEALLFSDTNQIAETFPEQSAGIKLSDIRAGFNSPEEINEGVESHPSKRIIDNINGYRKALHGPLIASRIGLRGIREQCSHFNEWVNWLNFI